MSERKVASIFTVTAQLVEGRQVSINGNFYDDQTVQQRNAALDDVLDIVERQRKRWEIPVLRKNLEQAQEMLKRNLSEMEYAVQEVEAKGQKAPAQLKMNIKTYQTNIQKIKDDIDKGASEVAALEAEVVRGAAHG